jgi:hypothetical protein
VVAHPLELAGDDDRPRVAEVDIGRGRVDAVLDDERATRGLRGFELSASTAAEGIK